MGMHTAGDSRKIPPQQVAFTALCIARVSVASPAVLTNVALPGGQADIDYRQSQRLF
jgi:hypothetical protein